MSKSQSRLPRFSKNAEKILKEAGAKHQFVHSGVGIRCNIYDCPLTAIYEDKFPGTYVSNTSFVNPFTKFALASKLNISVDTLTKIVNAADNPTNPYRERLEYLLGMRE